MRLLLTCVLAGYAGPALAMNREGHDDWMAGEKPARFYMEAVPHAHVLLPPREACSGETRRRAANPYEQIPLPWPDCRALEEEQEAGR